MYLLLVLVFHFLCMADNVDHSLCCSGNVDHFLCFSDNVDHYLCSSDNVDTVLCFVDNVLDILSAASHFQILPVVGACSGFIGHQLTVENCVDVATLADTYFLKELQGHAYRFMCNHYGQFSMSPSFQRLSPLQLTTLLQSNFPVDCPEWDVCYMALNWIEYKMEDRLPHAASILTNIFFQDIKVSELQKLTQSDTMKEVLAWNPQLKKHIFSKLGSRKVSVCSAQNLLNRRGYKETVIVAGGFTVESGMTNDILHLDTDTCTWKLLTKIPHVEQCNFGVSVLNNCLYVLGGCFDQNMQEVIHPYGFRFDPLRNVWSSIAPMLEERCRFYLGAVDDKLYAIGGDPSFSGDLIDDISRCECYHSDSDTWIEMAPLPGSRTQHAGTSYYHYLYVSGGLQELDNVVLDTVHCYDTRAEVWTSKASMLSPRADHTMFVYDNKIYVAGGWFEDEISHQRVLVRTIDCYDVSTDQWEMVTHLPEARLHATFTCLHDHLFVIGGSIDGDHEKKTKKVDILNLDMCRWEESIDFSHEVWEHTACSMFLPTVLST